jgi:D-alanyl-lipoteichoic acid acyltransferase DltB (MBOAT superfamily)
MVFNSFEFALFIVPVLTAYYLLGHRAQNALLLVAAYFFYGWWDVRFLGLLALSTGVDWFCARRIAAPETRHPRRYLGAAIGFSLILLGFFKYFNFFADGLVSLLQRFGLGASHEALAIILPVGISFYTFQSMSYVIDVYRGRQQPAESLFDYAVFVSFFPQLVAGPIERAHRMLPQFTRPRRPTLEGFYEGGYLVFWGLFKKVFVADNCAVIVNRIFRGETSATGFEYLIGIYAFTWQIYCDFSGYSDIARGLARMMGIELMQNFRMPYLSASLAEFWTRWHISLSQWFREYLYIPLGGNRVPRWRHLLNLMIVFAVSGLWHGAASKYVAWGFLHGAGLVAVVLLAGALARLRAAVTERVYHVLAVFLTFQFVAFAFGLWQARDLADYGRILHTMVFDFGFDPKALSTLGLLAAYVALPLFMQVLAKRADDPEVALRFSVPVRAALYLLVLFCVLRFGVISGAEFIYFQF